MQTIPVSWTMDDQGCATRPVPPSLGLDTLGGGSTRCRRCDIPLGSHPCPNPQCREPHGQSAGALCTWCVHHLQESLDVLDLSRVHTRALTGLPCAATRLGCAPGPLGGVPGADRVWEPGHGSRV